MLVVMQRVGGHHAFEVAAADDQQPVEAFATERADPALGVRPRPRCPYRRLDHTDALRAEDFVEVTRELAVAVTDQKPRLNALVVELHQQVAACWVTHEPSGFDVIPARCTRRVASSMTNST